MDKYRAVNTKFWDDPYIESLPSEGKLLFMYFLTSPQANLIGIYEITISRIEYNTKLSHEAIMEFLERFEADKKMFYFKKYNYVFIANFLKNQRLNKNMEIAASNMIVELPESIQKLLFGNRLETVSNPYNTIAQSLLLLESDYGKQEIPEINSCYIGVDVDLADTDKSVVTIVENHNKPTNQDKTPKNPFHSQMKSLFLEYYKRTKGFDFYWSPKEASALNQVYEKIRFSISSNGITDVTIPDSFSALLESISDKWILENMTVSIINSKYNELISKAKSKSGANSNYSAYAQDLLERLSPR